MKKENKQTMVPKLRFPEFGEAGEWALENGDQVFDQISNKKHNSNLPILAITQDQGAVPRNEIDYSVIVTDKSVESYKVVEIGDFIISLRSFQGGIEYSNYKGICSPAYIILRKKIDIKDSFFKYYFKTDLFINDLNKNIEGIRDGKMVTYKQFSELLLPLPQPDEQQKIATFLTSLDTLISAENEKLKALQAHKKGLMQVLFPAEGELVPKVRFREFEGEWEEKTLKKVFTIFQGFAFSSNDNIQNGVRWLKIADVSIQQMNHNAPSFLPETFKEKYQNFIVKEGDYVMALTRPILNKELKVARVDNTFHEALLNQRVGKIVTSQNIGFVYCLLQTSKLISDIEKSISGTEPPNLSAQQIETIETLTPTKDEQQKIADCLTSLDDLLAAQREKIEVLKRQKKGLMQQLFPNQNKIGEI
jgi:type I restriction enzyme, S subunit